MLDHNAATYQHRDVKLSPPFPPLPEKMPRDMQRSRVYEWEMRHFDEGRTETTSSARKLIEDIFREYCLPLPDVCVASNKRARRSFGGPSQIRLAPDAGRHTIIHECCHGIAPYYAYAHDEIEPWHGPTFCRLLLVTMNKYDGWAIGGAITGARELEIDIARAMSCPVPPESIRRRCAYIKDRPFEERVMQNCWLEAAEWRQSLPPALQPRDK